MVSDSISGASIATASSNPKDFSKKKRANRSAKLRQCKLDARREQWLSQVKNKGECKEEVNVAGDIHGGPARFMNERSMPIRKEEINPPAEGEIYGGGLSRNLYSDSEPSPLNSPTNPQSSLLGLNDSVAAVTASYGSNSSRSSSISNDFFPCSLSEDEPDACLDDWEAMADALSASEDRQQEHSSENGSLSSENHGKANQPDPHVSDANQPASRNGVSNAEQENGGKEIRNSCCAWSADDAFRPSSLPNLSRQHFNQREFTGDDDPVHPVPPSCPICYEDFDCTDSSFLPCPCGFRLCLFCHKKILEGGGHCPNCRKQYDHQPVEGEATIDGGRLTIRLTRSHSMKMRP